MLWGRTRCKITRAEEEDRINIGGCQGDFLSDQASEGNGGHGLRDTGGGGRGGEEAGPPAGEGGGEEATPSGPPALEERQAAPAVLGVAAGQQAPALHRAGGAGQEHAGQESWRQESCPRPWRQEKSCPEPWLGEEPCPHP